MPIPFSEACTRAGLQDTASYTVAEAAQILNVPARHLARWVRLKKLPATKYSQRTRLIARDDLAQFMVAAYQA